MMIEPGEDPARLAPIEGIVLVAVIGTLDEIPADLLPTGLEVRPQSLRGRKGRVAIADQKVRGQVRRASVVVGRLTATVNQCMTSCESM
jgi:hypothetical protein